MGLLSAYVYTYLDPLIIRLLPAKPNAAINFVVHLVVIGGLSLATTSGIAAIVKQVADANLAIP